MGMLGEQKINILENKVKSEVPDIIRISIFLSKMNPYIRLKKFVHYNGKYPIYAWRSLKIMILIFSAEVSITYVLFVYPYAKVWILDIWDFCRPRQKIPIRVKYLYTVLGDTRSHF